MDQEEGVGGQVRRLVLTKRTETIKIQAWNILNQSFGNGCETIHAEMMLFGLYG